MEQVSNYDLIVFQVTHRGVSNQVRRQCFVQYERDVLADLHQPYSELYEQCVEVFAVAADPRWRFYPIQPYFN